MQPSAPVRWNRARRAAAAALATAFAVLLPATVASAWVRGTILSTDGYVAAVTPVAGSPAVRAAIQDAAGNRAGRFVASQAFQRLWADANRQAHGQLVSVLDGDRNLPLFPAAALAGPRQVYRVLVAVSSLVPALTALTLAGALAVSPRRRRTLLQMTVGGTLTVLAAMIAVSWGQSRLVDRAAPRYQAATSVLAHALTSGFFTMATWCAVGGFVVTAAVLLSGRRVPVWQAIVRGRLPRHTSWSAGDGNTRRRPGSCTKRSSTTRSSG